MLLYWLSSKDHTKSWFGLWTSIPSMQQMFAPGMAANSVSSITDKSGSRDPTPAAWTWRSRTVECIFCCSDIVEQISQPCLERDSTNVPLPGLPQWIYTLF
ncbi:hypothetical protein VZT92_007512 [Zoarces viviparus]|uniref:Uncharacterized protein n=1 Tax=Zoarces viviparus TaxID=48416 RepID=A0AAW1FLQ1_ZOAVI